MPRWSTRAVAPDDSAAFADFERCNRPDFERFNEPRTPSRYRSAGLLHAFNRCLEQHRAGRQFTRVVAADGDTHWLGMGSLTVHATAPQPFGVLVYQTYRRQWRQGVGSALVADLIREAGVQGMDRLQAQITCDNLVSLHLLRQAGFHAVGWARPATLRRGTVECLLLERVVLPVGQAVVVAPLAGAHMHQTA